MYISAYRLQSALLLPQARFGASSSHSPAAIKADFNRLLTERSGFDSAAAIYNYATQSVAADPNTAAPIYDALVEHMQTHDLGQPNNHPFALHERALTLLLPPEGANAVILPNGYFDLMKAQYANAIRGLLPQLSNTEIEPLAETQAALIKDFFPGDLYISYGDYFDRTPSVPVNVATTFSWVVTHITEQLPETPLRDITVMGIAYDAMRLFYQDSDSPDKDMVMRELKEILKDRIDKLLRKPQ